MIDPEEQNRVFVVEDDTVYRELLVFALSSEGYVVYVAENGARAVELFDSVQPDIVLLDMLMPVMDGLRFLEWLRNEAESTVPTLVLTCLDDKAFIVDALVAGANDVLLKPISLEALVGKIEVACQGQTS